MRESKVESRPAKGGQTGDLRLGRLSTFVASVPGSFKVVGIAVSMELDWYARDISPNASLHV